MNSYSESWCIANCCKITFAAPLIPKTSANWAVSKYFFRCKASMTQAVQYSRRSWCSRSETSAWAWEAATSSLSVKQHPTSERLLQKHISTFNHRIFLLECWYNFTWKFRAIHNVTCRKIPNVFEIEHKTLERIRMTSWFAQNNIKTDCSEQRSDWQLKRQYDFVVQKYLINESNTSGFNFRLMRNSVSAPIFSNFLPDSSSALRKRIRIRTDLTAR